MGKFSRSNEAHAGKIKSLKIKLPINEDGTINLGEQISIAENYGKIIELKNKIEEKISELQEVVNSIDVFK
jgi:hypothetical protein